MPRTSFPVWDILYVELSMIPVQYQFEDVIYFIYFQHTYDVEYFGIFIIDPQVKSWGI